MSNDGPVSEPHDYATREADAAHRERREEIAKHLLAGMMSDPENSGGDKYALASVAVHAADALIVVVDTTPVPKRA